MAKVTVRFFKIERVHETAPDLEVALQSAFASADKASDREREVFGQTLRLERLTKDNTFFDGEIVRKQTGDIPPEANDNGLQKLSVSEGGGIGHCIAFRYSVALQAVAIQFDNRAVSVNRFLAYLREFDPTYDYRAEAMVRKDAWTKYNRGLPTKLQLTVAQPQNLASVEGEVGSVIESTRTLAEIHDGPVITVEIKMGRKKGSLAKDVVDGVLKYFTSGPGAEEDVRKLSATSVNEDGAEAINFLNDLLKERRDIDVPEGDPDGHYGKRQSWITTCFNSHFDYIKEVYGASSVAIS
ncbi:MAG: hypothetical protein AAFV74_20015 [Pseudomonadota bacterium]